MRSDHLFKLFDRKPRHSQSTSDLRIGPPTQHEQRPEAGSRSPRARPYETLTTIDQSGFFEPHQPAPSYLQPPALKGPIYRPHNQRASTTPMLYPPDELFLKMIRRRSADARLEEARIIQAQQQRREEESSISIAIATALPPLYLDPPPGYYSPVQEMPTVILFREPQYGAGRARVESRRTSQDTTHKSASDGLSRIDDTMEQYAPIRLTEATRRPSSREQETIVSPINEIDRMNLERRKRNKREQKRLMNTQEIRAS